MYEVVYQIVKHQSLRVETKQRVTTPTQLSALYCLVLNAECAPPRHNPISSHGDAPRCSPPNAAPGVGRGFAQKRASARYIQVPSEHTTKHPQKSAEMSSDLTWLLVRNWNSFQVKGGHGPVFSREKVSKEVWVGQCRA